MESVIDPVESAAGKLSSTPELFERILSPVDFSEFSVRAYSYACALAQRYHARLIAEHVVELWQHPCAEFATSSSAYEDFCTEMMGVGRERLREFVREHTPVGVAAECAIQQGMARDCILSLAEIERAGLIVMGTHGMRGLERLLLGSVTETVLQAARCPVLAVHGAGAGAQGGLELREIILCCDCQEEPHAESKRALQYAVALAADFHAKLTVLQVRSGMARLHRDAGNERACASLLQWVEKCAGPGCTETAVVRTGSIAREVSRLASEKKAGVVVMAAHRRHGVNEGLLGADLYRVLLLGNCPVLAVPGGAPDQQQV